MRWLLGFSAMFMTGSAMYLPWSHWGDIEIRLVDLPHWYAYAVPAVLMIAAAWWRRDVAIGCAALAVVPAVVLTFQYGNAEALFPDGAVPAVVPALGPGGPFAVLGAVLVGVLLATRRPASAEESTHHPR